MSPPGSSQASLCSLCSLHELVKHEENGLVFEDSEELAVQLQVGTAAPTPGLGGFAGSHRAGSRIPCSCSRGPVLGLDEKPREGGSGSLRGWVSAPPS